MAKKPAGSTSVAVDMTPMIDIVFQLLIFFIMSFKIITPEGDFSVKMPMSPAQGEPDPDSLPPIQIRLKANSSGALTEVSIGEKIFGQGENGLMKLRDFVLKTVAPNGGPPTPAAAEATEVELSCDYKLKYEHCIRCISYVTGYKQGNDVIRIAEKIKFAAPIGGR